MPFVIKVKYEEDTRRITLEQVPSFEGLVSVIKTLFPNLPSSFTIKYFDEDEDAVTISSDMELNEAARVAATNNLLRLQLIAKSADKPQNSPNNSQQFPTMAEILANPAVCQKWFESFIGTQPQTSNNQNNPKPSDVPDLVSLFQHLGLNAQQMNGSTNQDPQQNAQQNIQQLTQNLLSSPYIQQFMPQLMSMFPQLLPLLGGFNAFPQSSPSNTPRSETGKEEENTHHYGVVCDVCEAPISGVRYKCTTCINYDLCAKCEAKPGSHDPSHVLLKIQKPLSVHPSAYGRGCPYMRPRNVNNNSETSRWNRGCRRTAQQSGFLSRFVQDVSIPDGTAMNAGEKFVKIWRLRNEGEIAWPEGTYLEFVGGDKLSVHKEIAVPPAVPGSEVDIAVDMVAPAKPGRYVSYWRLCNVDGSRFGQRVWLDIYVQNDEQTQLPSQATQTQETVQTQQSTQTQETVQNQQSTQTQQMNSMEVETQTNALNTSNKSTGTSVTMSSSIGTSTEEKQTKDVAVSSADPFVYISPEVKSLLDMGFENPEQLQFLVAKHSGDLVAVVQDLLKM